MGSIMRYLRAAALGAVFVMSVPAHAVVSTPAAAGFAAMRELNLIVLGDMAGASNVEGKAFIGGNLTNGTQFGVGRGSQGATPSARPTLTVVGSTSGNSVQLQNGPNGGMGNVGTPPGMTVGGNLAGGLNLNATGATVRVGGSIANTNGSSGSTISAGGSSAGFLNANGATVSLNLGAGFTNPLVADLVAQRSKLDQDLKALSGALSALPETDANSISLFGGRRTFNAVDNGRGFSVFTVGSEIFGSSEFDMTLSNPGMLVVVNVLGSSSYTWNANSIGGLNASLNDQVIWNFGDATDLFINRMTHGSILAPWAHLRNTADLEGSIAVGRFTQGGQIHLGTLSGDMPVVPEPGTWAMLIAGFGVVGMAARRRRAVAQ
jgi:choice-of-anchor A domain-containing protein